MKEKKARERERENHWKSVSVTYDECEHVCASEREAHSEFSYFAVYLSLHPSVFVTGIFFLCIYQKQTYSFMCAIDEEPKVTINSIMG